MRNGILEKKAKWLISGRVGAMLCAAGLMMLPSGCATTQHGERHFEFQTDTFSYANDLVWEYYFDEHGKWRSHPRDPKPDYTHHCFVVARSAMQFFEHARFEPALPVADEATYRRLVRRVVGRSPRHVYADVERVVIPGYANLRTFSAAQEALLKSECGGAWQSYFQHGHWRMIMPLTRGHQERMAAQLVEDLKANRPPVVHVVRFPHLTINHAVVLFDATESATNILFSTYDPNKPDKPAVITFDRASKTFLFPANDYFPGGRVDVYEIYRDWRY
jgi:hypothetical protein